MKTKTTNRGFSIIEFKDYYDGDCSIQKSSLATEDCIWFGREKGTHADGQCIARMHLSCEQVKVLIPILQKFAKTGKLTTQYNKKINHSPN